MEAASAVRGVSRETWIGLGALAVAIAAMAVDHLLGTDPDSDDSGLVDPGTFAIAVGLSLAVAVFLFGRLVPRARAAGPDGAAKVGLMNSLLGLVTAVGFLWLGFPFLLAGAGIALGLVGTAGERRRLAIAAVILGAIVGVLGAGIYVDAAIRRLS